MRSKEEASACWLSVKSSCLRETSYVECNSLDAALRLYLVAVDVLYDLWLDGAARKEVSMNSVVG